MIREVFAGNSNIVVESFSGLLVDYMQSRNAQYIIRGLRAVSDFEYEFQMAFANRNINNSVETIFMVPGSQYLFLSSTSLSIFATSPSILNTDSETIIAFL